MSATTENLHNPPAERPKPRQVTPAEVDTICQCIAQGGTYRKAAKLVGWTDRTALWKEIMGCAEHRAAYAYAREVRAQGNADKVQSTARKVETGALEPDAGRVVIQAHQWLAKVQDRNRFGDQPMAAPDQPQGIAPDAVLAQLLAMDAGTGLLAKLGLKIERTTVTAAAQVETKPPADPDALSKK